MPGLSEDDDAAADTSPDPVDTTSDTEGSSGDAAETSEPAKGAGAKKPDPPKEDDSETDSTDDLLSAFDEGLKESSGEPATEDETETKDGDKPAEGDEEAAKDETEDGDEAKATEPDPDDLTETERKNVSKSVGKKIEKLVKLKGPAAFGTRVFEHANTLGLIGKDADGKQDFRPMQTALDTMGYVNKHKVEDRPLALADVAVRMVNPQAKDAPSKAAELRKLADRISPLPKSEPTVRIVMMPDDLAALVSNEQIKPEEAQRLAIERLRAKGDLKEAEAPKPAETTKTVVPPPADDTQAKHEARVQKGKDDALAAYAEIEKRHKDDLTPERYKEIVARVKERSGTVQPEGLAQLVKDQVAIVLANARKGKPVKKPITTSPRPGSGGGKQPAVDASDWDSAIDETVKVR